MDGPGDEREAEPPAAGLRAELPAEPESVPELRRIAREFAQEAGASARVAADVALAVSEAVTNAVVHAFVERPPGRVALAMEAGAGQLQVSVADDGRGMQPRADSPGLGLGL